MYWHDFNLEEDEEDEELEDLEEESDLIFNTSVRELYDSGFSFTRQLRNFMAKYKVSRKVGKWALTSLDGISAWIKKRKRAISQKIDEDVAKNEEHHQKNGIKFTASTLLLEASKLCDKVLTPDQKKTLNEYMDKIQGVFHCFQRWLT